MKIVYVEYDMPGPSRMPWDANPGKSGKIWIPEFSPFNGIAALDPATGKMEEYKEPETHPAFTHSVVEAPDGSAWLTEQATNKIGRWDPVTKQITEYQDYIDPAKVGLRSGGSKHTLRVDSKGIVWASGTPFSKFDPKTGKFTEIPVAPNTYGVEKDKYDNIWFDGFTPDGKLFKVDGETGKITGYQPPTAGLPRRITPDSDGIVWFAEFRAGKIGRFDPKTETFKEYTLPGPDASPYALGIDKNHYVWYSSEQMDIVGRLDPKTGEVLEYPFPQSENAMRATPTRARSSKPAPPRTCRPARWCACRTIICSGWIFPFPWMTSDIFTCKTRWRCRCNLWATSSSPAWFRVSPPGSIMTPAP